MASTGQDKSPTTPENAPEKRGSSRCDADRAAEAAPGPYVPGEDLEKRQDQLLDEAVEETFPASDPIAPKRITK